MTRKKQIFVVLALGNQTIHLGSFVRFVVIYRGQVAHVVEREFVL